MINRLSNPINRNYLAAKISKVMSSSCSCRTHSSVRGQDPNNMTDTGARCLVQLGSWCKQGTATSPSTPSPPCQQSCFCRWSFFCFSSFSSFLLPPVLLCFLFFPFFSIALLSPSPAGRQHFVPWAEQEAAPVGGSRQSGEPMVVDLAAALISEIVILIR